MENSPPFYLISSLKEEISYLIKKLHKHKEISSRILTSPINSFSGLQNSKYDRSLLELLDHAFFSFFVQWSKSYSNLELSYVRNQIQTYNSLDQLISFLDEFQTILGQHIKSNSISDGNVNKYTKLAKSVGHLIQHLGQVILLLGLIIEDK